MCRAVSAATTGNFISINYIKPAIHVEGSFTVVYCSTCTKHMAARLTQLHQAHVKVVRGQAWQGNKVETRPAMTFRTPPLPAAFLQRAWGMSQSQPACTGQSRAGSA